MAYRGETLNGDGMLVSGSYFPLLGLRPALGRLIGPPDDETVGAHAVAVLSYGFWQSHLGGDADVLNQTIVINGNSLTVIGVAPRGFEGTTLGARPLVFVPITMSVQVWQRFDTLDDRRDYWAYLFARLEPGVSIERAAVAVNAVYAPIVNDVEAPLQEGFSDAAMARFRSKQIGLEPGRRGQSQVHGNTRMPLILLLTTTGIVLLIACGNIANLLLARGANRSNEMAIRRALGANRPRVVAQLLTESLVLAVLGGVASLFVAHWTLALIGSILPPESAATIRLELRTPVVLFAAALAIGTGLLFGLFPALHSTRPDLVSTMRANAGNILGARSAVRFRSALVTAQVALSMALLVSAGLFLKSLLNVARVDLGLSVDNVVTFRVSPQLNGYEPERTRVLFARIEEELAALPGVTGVTGATVRLLASSNSGSNVSVQGFERGPDIDDNANYNEVGPDYFGTLAIPLLAGREFTVSDAVGSPKVAVVNEAFAEKFNLAVKRSANGWPSEAPIRSTCRSWGSSRTRNTAR